MLDMINFQVNQIAMVQREHIPLLFFFVFLITDKILIGTLMQEHASKSEQRNKKSIEITRKLL